MTKLRINSEENTRTIRVTATPAIYRDIDIQLPYYGKSKEANTDYFYKLTADRLYTLAFYHTLHEIKLYSCDPNYCLDGNDEEVAGWDISSRDEWDEQFAVYLKHLEGI